MGCKVPDTNEIEVYGLRIRVRVLGSRTWGRLNVVWCRGFFQLLWGSEWGVVNGYGDVGWTRWRPVFTFGRSL